MKWFLSLVVASILFVPSLMAQCPDASWTPLFKDIPINPSCTLRIHYCARQWGLTGPGNDFIEINVGDIDFIGTCTGPFPSVVDILNAHLESIFLDIIDNTQPTIALCPQQTRIFRVSAGDCRTDYYYSGIAWTSSPCGVASQCIRQFDVCWDGQLGRYRFTPVTMPPPPPSVCGTKGINVDDQFDIDGTVDGVLNVQCLPFCF